MMRRDLSTDIIHGEPPSDFRPTTSVAPIGPERLVDMPDDLKASWEAQQKRKRNEALGITDEVEDRSTSPGIEASEVGSLHRTAQSPKPASFKAAKDRSLDVTRYPKASKSRALPTAGSEVAFWQYDPPVIRPDTSQETHIGGSEKGIRGLSKSPLTTSRVSATTYCSLVEEKLATIATRMSDGHVDNAIIIIAGFSNTG
jgi:hypothetical protein